VRFFDLVSENMSLPSSHPSPHKAKVSKKVKKKVINPSVAIAGGLQSQGAKGAAAVNLLQALGNAGSGVLRLSRRGKKMA
jgi:hypothetical protein